MSQGPEISIESGELLPTNIDADMDFRLQRLLALRQRGVILQVPASVDFDEVPVIAKVTDPDAWRRASEVRASTQIGPVDQADGTAIVTGRIPATRIEVVRRFDYVRSLKAAQPLRPALADGIAETEANPASLPTDRIGEGGQGVVIGIIDYGCDFAHRNFLNDDGTTRLLAIWQQNGVIDAQGRVKYGREFDAAAINRALGAADPYADLGYGPLPDTAREKGTHGTHVMDIAAGNGRGSGVAGFAPQADLVFVDVSHKDLPISGPDLVGSFFGDSTLLLEAVEYIFGKAGARPCVINISLGTNGGPHDGTSLVEEGIDRLLRAAPNRAVTIAVANAYADGIHATGRLTQDGALDLLWRVPAGRQAVRELEIWYAADDRFSVEVIAPSGKSLGTLMPGQNGADADEHGEIFAANRLAEPNNGDNMIGVVLGGRVEAGDWTVRLRGRVVRSGAFHAWIERDDASQSSFRSPVDPSVTIGSISCGHLTLAVGSYDAHDPLCPLSWFSSAGPTRDGREKPEISAPGHGVLAARSQTGTGVIAKSGSSMAAPAVAGIVALLLSEARARGLDLSADEIRAIMIAAVRHQPPQAAGWHDRYGFGRAHARRAIEEVIRRAPPIATV
ncbi:S8 family peptidase [Methylobacterium sp. ID0610]|uniref:S8 family peptidase n=1 Tax=Methylobacterium carpenticola TaxID=3344827 RepID=UPI00367E7E44